VARRRRIGLVIVGGLGIAAVAAWFVLAPAKSRGSAPKGPSERESAGQADPTLLRPDLVATPTAGSAQVSSQDAGDEAEQQARRIIADSRAAYAACDTYEDDGKYDIVFRGDAGFSDEMEFHTAVAGPGAIRFAYRDLPTEFQDARFTQLVINDAGVLDYDPGEHEPERMQSLDAALGALMGVSHGLTGAVIPLLPIGVDMPGAIDVYDARVVGAEEIDGTMCDVIDAVRRYGPFDATEHVRIWIAETDSLIRRLSEDLVQSEDDTRQLGATRAREREALDRFLREAGVSDGEIEVVHSAIETPITTFSTVTFHPRCNEPVRPGALLATDGSL
jgi:hypothetical protein